MTLLQRFRLFVWRRGHLMGAVSGTVIATALLLILLLPYSYTARASLGTSSPAGYEGPVTQLIARVTSRHVLTEVAKESGLDQPLGLGGMLAGLESDPAERLRAELQPHPAQGPVDRLSVEVSGRDEAGVLKASRLVASRLVEFDRALRRMTRSQRERGELPSESSGKPARLQLEELRQKNPLLRDTTATARFQREESELAEAGIALATLSARHAGAVAAASRLEAQVRDEANQAYAADMEARARRARERAMARAEAEAQRKPTPQTRPDAPTLQRTATPSKAALLEAELQRLLAVYTRRHPDVRRILRKIKVAREHEATLPEPTPVEPEAETKPVSHDADHSLIPIADDDQALGAALAPPIGEAPSHWIQLAPSYMLWIEAKNRAEDAKIALDTNTQTHAQRTKQHKALAKRLEALRAARLDEQRLLALVREEERQRDGEQAKLYEPLVMGKEAYLLPAVSPWRYLPWGVALALMAGLIAGWIGDLHDRSFFAAKEISERVGLPVLGVIPHLRGR